MRITSILYINFVEYSHDYYNENMFGIYINLILYDIIKLLQIKIKEPL